MAFLNSLNISGSGMTAQRLRLDVASENIANIETTRTESGDPYRRKVVVFEEKESFDRILKRQLSGAGSLDGVVVSEIAEDPSELQLIYEPDHPDADENGYVAKPNVDLVKETTDAMAATRSYEANITAFNAVKDMAMKALELGKQRQKVAERESNQ